MSLTHMLTRAVKPGTAWTLLAFLPFLFAVLALAAPNFPPLTGRVVDAANILKPEERASIEAKLKAHEDKTTDQVVVATVPSLDGLEIEDYGNRLFRAWELGQKGKNNGVLVLIAPNDRKLRIEVGYGLEGTLTDALSKVIASTSIAPKFKSGDFAGGIDAGIDAVLSTLTNDAAEWQDRAKVRNEELTTIDWVIAAFVLLLMGALIYWVFKIIWAIITVLKNASYSSGGSYGSSSSRSSYSSSSYSSSSSSSSYSGGGGSSGGGGASASW
jgi:uncharacterized protein